MTLRQEIAVERKGTRRRFDVMAEQITAEGEKTRRHFDVVAEQQITAEGKKTRRHFDVVVEQMKNGAEPIAGLLQGHGRKARQGECRQCGRPRRVREAFGGSRETAVEAGKPVGPRPPVNVCGGPWENFDQVRLPPLRIARKDPRAMGAPAARSLTWAARTRA